MPRLHIITVLGHTDSRTGANPSPQLTSRIKKGVKEYKRLTNKHDVCFLLLTGTAQEVTDMQRFVERGIHVVPEINSQNTIENATYSRQIILKILRDNQSSEFKGKATVHIVTNTYHCPRAMWIFEQVFAKVHHVHLVNVCAPGRADKNTLAREKSALNQLMLIAKIVHTNACYDKRRGKLRR
jgi:vancomycin permeability regulator SanA